MSFCVHKKRQIFVNKIKRIILGPYLFVKTRGHFLLNLFVETKEHFHIICLLKTKRHFYSILLLKQKT